MILVVTVIRVRVIVFFFLSKFSLLKQQKSAFFLQNFFSEKLSARAFRRFCSLGVSRNFFFRKKKLFGYKLNII